MLLQAAALTPILAPLALLVVARMRAGTAMPVCLALTASAAWLVWRVPPGVLAAATLEGWLLAITILWIVLGALSLLGVLRAAGAVDALRARIAAASPDARVQILLIAWLFGGFLESVAGFGTPAAICAPLLVGLGFAPLAAAVMCLAANCVSVTFGAAGTPVLVGMVQGLRGHDGAAELALTSGAAAAAVNVAVGSFIPLVLILLFSRFFAPERSARVGLRAWKPALLAGFGFTVPAFVAARWLGPEFPSILGAACGFGLLWLALRRGWIAGGTRAESDPTHEPPAGTLPFARAAAPYLWLGLLLAATRLVPPLKAWLQGVTLSAMDLLGTGIGASFPILYSPGTVFLVVTALAAWRFRVGATTLRAVARETGSRLLPAALALGAALPMARIFVHSGVNDAGLVSMPLFLAERATEITGAGWVMAAPFVGALGSFLSGSATFGNLMFAGLQLDAARGAGIPVQLGLALQQVGAAAGNMISVLNVVAVAAVTGLSGREGSILRLTFLPMLFYCLAAGLVGLAVMR